MVYNLFECSCHFLSFLIFLLIISFIHISSAILNVHYSLLLPCSPTHPLLLPGPGIPLYWGIRSSQDQGPLLQLMADQAILCYICNQGHSSRGCWIVDIVVPPIGLQTPLRSLGTFSSSFIGGLVFHPIDDCEHPLLYLLGTGIASQETAIS